MSDAPGNSTTYPGLAHQSPSSLRSRDPVNHVSEADLRGRCPVCLTALIDVHCKRLCSNCGYREDCSDLF